MLTQLRMLVLEWLVGWAIHRMAPNDPATVVWLQPHEAACGALIRQRGLRP